MICFRFKLLSSFLLLFFVPSLHTFKCSEHSSSLHHPFHRRTISICLSAFLDDVNSHRLCVWFVTKFRLQQILARISSKTTLAVVFSFFEISNDWESNLFSRLCTVPCCLVSGMRARTHFRFEFSQCELLFSFILKSSKNNVLIFNRHVLYGVGEITHRRIGRCKILCPGFRFLVFFIENYAIDKFVRPCYSVQHSGTTRIIKRFHFQKLQSTLSPRHAVKSNPPPYRTAPFRLFISSCITINTNNISTLVSVLVL